MKDYITNDSTDLENLLREFNKTHDITTLKSALLLHSSANILMGFIKKQGYVEELGKHLKELDKSVLVGFGYAMELSNFMMDRLQKK